jgi:hypothetical protein
MDWGQRDKMKLTDWKWADELYGQFKKRVDMNYLELSNPLGVNPKNPLEIKIRELIKLSAPENRESLIYAVPELLIAAKDPKTAKKKWLTRLYEKKGWINSDFAAELMKKESEKALLELETICLKNARLRPFGTLIPCYRLSSDKQELSIPIKQTLENSGINIEGLKVRYIYKKEQLPTAMLTGNDRTVSSFFHQSHHNGYDGEKLAMIRHGITSATETTYVDNLKNWKHNNLEEDPAILIYSPDALDGIGPLGFMLSNQFHAFHFCREVMQRSLLAVFEK